MKPINIYPCSPIQRQSGWEEALSINDIELPAGWEIRPNSDIYSLGAIHANIVPVYCRINEENIIDWWMQIQVNKASFGSSIFEPTPQDKFSRITIAQIENISQFWMWTDSAKDHFNLQKSSMLDCEDKWLNMPSADILDNLQDFIIVPDSSLYPDWGFDNYNPGLFEDKESIDKYSVLRRDSLIHKKSVAFK